MKNTTLTLQFHAGANGTIIEATSHESLGMNEPSSFYGPTKTIILKEGKGLTDLDLTQIVKDEILPALNQRELELELKHRQEQEKHQEMYARQAAVPPLSALVR